MVEIVDIDYIIPKRVKKIKIGDTLHEVREMSAGMKFQMMAGRFEEHMMEDPMRAYEWLFEDTCPSVLKIIREIPFSQLEAVAVEVFDVQKKLTELGRGDVQNLMKLRKMTDGK